MLLLDTHVWVWFLQGNKKINPLVIKSIDAAIGKRELFIAAISSWELAMLIKKSRIILNKPIALWIAEALDKLHIKVIPLSTEVAIESTDLPGEFHGDPADRMIIATARLHHLTVVTRDAAILHYGKSKHVRVLEA